MARRLLSMAVVAMLLSGASAQPPPPPGGGAMGGGAVAPTSTSPHAAAMLGNVGKTTATGTDARTGKYFAAGQDIYGPFEAGFGSQQDNILMALGCATGAAGYVQGGVDTMTAEQMVASQCGITLPRVEGSKYVSLLDECGGHTQYHFHERLSCLYNTSAPGHSTKVGETLGGQPLYGKWESTSQRPALDACGGHFGRTPESPGADVYHYHMQDAPPFTIGCIGPNSDGSLVTVEQCRSFYTGCDGVLIDVTTKKGTFKYDPWCPCYDADNSNVGSGATTTTSPGASPAPSNKGNATTSAAGIHSAALAPVALLALGLALAQ